MPQFPCYTLTINSGVLCSEGRRDGLEEGLEHGRDEGLERGRREGLEGGLQRGREERARAVVEVLRRRGISSTDEQAQRITECRDEVTLTRWWERVWLGDSILESKGATPVVEVALELGGREIVAPEALERLLDELRSRILHELEAHHGVRLKG